MACFISNILQQKQILSLTLCKYPSPSLNACKFHFLSHVPGSSPLKHTPLLVDTTPGGNILHAKLSATDHDSPTKTINSRTRKENNALGFPSSRKTAKRDGRKHIKNRTTSVVDEKTEKRFSKDRNTIKNMDFRERKGMGSEDCTKDGNKGIKVLATMDSQGVSGEMESRAKNGSDIQVIKMEKIGKGSKQDKVDSSEIRLRVRLDMCSKRGDVIAAIQLYDLAQRERIKMGQYHYAVLLYLCSSAAVGVVQPAKSGSESGRRTIGSLDVSNEVSNVKFQELSELRDEDDRKAGATELHIRVSYNRKRLVDADREPGSIAEMELNHRNRFGDFSDKESLVQFSNECNSPHLDGRLSHGKDKDTNMYGNHEIQFSEDVKKYALQRGFEIFEKMCKERVPLNEATLTSVARMAMSIGNGDLAFDMVKQMDLLGINPKLRSYGPALSVFCSDGDIDKAFYIEKHMLEHGVYPEEPELKALLRVSVEGGRSDKVYYLLHKLRTSLRRVSPSTAGIIVRWFNSKAASRAGKTKWDVKEVIESGGGGWHGQGWLGKGKWTVSCTSVGLDGICKYCGQQLTTIDLDAVETEKFAESVASLAIKRDRDSSFQKFQKWLDYYGPFEAVIDGANAGIYNQGRFMPSKINAVVNGIRQKLPSKKWPLIVLHNKRITGRKMEGPVNKAFIEKWKNADALYATPTGSNDDWYWLYAAIKFKCLIVTNDEMRDHTFHLLGNDFFPRWKERHQVHFRFTDAGPDFDMPPPCSVVIQESENGHWHIPIESECEGEGEAERQWLCITRANSRIARHSMTEEGSQSVGHSKKQARSRVAIQPERVRHSILGNMRKPPQDYNNLKNILAASGFPDHRTVLSEIETAEELGDTVIDFQI
ncbi:hypothetical protein OIU77_030485 [Salix suchowensis]|uniref:ribonuclease P n=2 Tax=Salix suchowensis TaxID=1278906 RepID=A0ABQ9BC40_9ROSI|nr:proteinaceous RNase [Salix suchowensis]KAJ6362501.1 hypothetical protein OIU78_002830 [Salix suchowensis]KAJ6381829.1 hypothetical protein OIU77_030485 [Salix suchowensis]